MSASARPHDPDGGLAGERTDLAWGRTGLSMLAILGSLLRRVLLTNGPAQAVAVIVGLVGAAAWGLGLRHARHLANTTSTGRHQAEIRTMVTITVGTLVIAAAGGLLAVFPG